MKTKHDWKGLFFIMMGFLLIGCAAQKPQTPFQPQALQAGGYSQKVDNFLVILDASGSARGRRPSWRPPVL